ncbi:aminodeoxychorismate synthase component I [soil metagenome]
MNADRHVHLLERLELPLPLEAYREAFPGGRGGFVLDSRTAAGEALTLLGAEPFLAFRAFRGDRRLASGALGARVEIEEQGVTVRAEVDDAFVVLRALLREHAVDPAASPADRPFPLLAGAVGYVGYETGQMLERLPCAARPGLGMPDIALFFHDWVLARCHGTGESWLSVVGRGRTMVEARSAAAATRDRLRRVLTSFVPAGSVASGGSTAVRAVTSRARYLADIVTAKQHIDDGDAFEICLTHRLDAPFTGDPFALWQELRRQSPAPYATFLDLPEAAVVSSSPERFLSLDAARVAESRPIKGTRPRGITAQEDARLAADLATAAKDRAENAMIVDLVRNDLGRVCRFGSVEAPQLFAVERYATVHQLVSTVRGELDVDRDAIDLVRACFPPGSMTGAPKIEAMTILEGLEPTERGVYAGALGWLDFGGTMDLSVVIRTIVVKDGVAHLHVGGAIVADSDPEMEHDETMHKARAPLAALAALADAQRAAPLPAAAASSSP